MVKSRDLAIGTEKQAVKLFGSEWFGLKASAGPKVMGSMIL